MYEISDTIVALSSPRIAAATSTAGALTIIRISGPETFGVLDHILSSPAPRAQHGIFSAKLHIDRELQIEAKVYTFVAPRSYSGNDLAEIHVCTSQSVVERLIEKIINEQSTAKQKASVRLAGPGEFTARAYLNGKIDLAQAEAVAEIVASSNKFQLAAAEKLLAGELGKTVTQIRQQILDILSLIEAGLDFGTEDICFVTTEQAVGELDKIKNELSELLASSIRYEALIDVPAVGIAGAANSGKSSLLNVLLGRDRSIVSNQRATTRDILTGLLELKNCNCVLFDCAGLIEHPSNILEELAQAAAIEAINSASVVIFCVDVSNESYADELKVLKLINPGLLVPVATKCDICPEELLAERIGRLSELTGAEFMATSSSKARGIKLLRETIDSQITQLTIGSVASGKTVGFDTSQSGVLTLTARHTQAVDEALGNISEAIGQLKAQNDEVAAMLLRAGYRALSGLEQENIDEAILERIFSRFCIGK